MSRGLFELRLRAPEGIGRVLYCVAPDRKIMMLHVFVKKTEKTPARELEIARKLMKVLLDV
jgi:phage-related protein